MAKMKFSKNDDIDWAGLDEEEFDPDDDGGFVAYDGEIPPAGILLKGDVTKLWLVKSQAGDWMYKALFIADCGHDTDSDGLCEEDCKYAEYNGCPIWDNVLWSLPQVKFKWGHFLNGMGITLKDIRAKTVVDDEEDNIGLPVKKVGVSKLPYPMQVITARGKFEGKTKPEVKKWVLAGDEVDDDDDDDEDDAPVAKKRPAKKTGKKSSKKSRDDDDEDDLPF